MSDKPSDQYFSSRRGKEGTPIEFDEYKPHGDYVTGIARYSDPQGFGEFAIRVSGSEAAIHDYAAEARIINLQVIPLNQMDTRAASDQRHAAVEYWRSEWDQRLKTLKQFVDTADVELLADPDRLWQVFREVERAKADLRTRPIWGRDRLIQIEPIGGVVEGEAYWFTMTIDPSLNGFGADYYPLWSSGSWSWPSVQNGSVSADEFAVYSERDTDRYVAVHETAGARAEYTITVNGVYYR